MSVGSPDEMKLQGLRVGRILDGKLVGVTPNPASENPSYTKSL
ncbi:hypothetical protein U27_04646 [Candidatus Vecturithrix granuli]|uniref:Uncharacterized protein n=1 Tax=Vecturithrix granuli TaxID=1499967 RepID=A0A081BZC4_VECG1|nr:hypothetical protein U27_04646 [Candidatus Vecturithrix granuli]